MRLILPALLSFARAIDLLLTLLLPTLLTLGAVLLLFLTALFRALLLLDLLFISASFLFVAARFALLLPLLARGLVFLTPLFSPAPSALSIREITCARQRGGYRKRQPNLF